MVEALFDEETDDAIGVEEEVAPAGLLVADDGVERLELGGLGEGEDRGREGGGRGLGRRRVLEDHRGLRSSCFSRASRGYVSGA